MPQQIKQRKVPVLMELMLQGERQTRSLGSEGYSVLDLRDESNREKKYKVVKREEKVALEGFPEENIQVQTRRK